jgi:hypothetical protein
MWSFFILEGNLGRGDSFNFYYFLVDEAMTD